MDRVWPECDECGSRNIVHKDETPEPPIRYVKLSDYVNQLGQPGPLLLLVRTHSWTCEDCGFRVEVKG